MNSTALRDEMDVTDAPGTAVVRVATRALESVDDVRAAMARLDDEEITQACLGVVTKTWLYEFPIKSKGGASQTVTGISAAGAIQIARIRAAAGFPLKFPTDPRGEEIVQNGVLGIRVIVTMRDARSGAEAVGMVFEPYLITERDGRERPNDFADRKALAKARRNAILDLIPEEQALELLKAAKASAAGKPAPRQQAAVASPQRTEARRVTPAENAAPRDPYQNGATEEQISRLLDLVGAPTCTPNARERVERGLKAGISAKQAASWITALEVAADPQAAAVGGEPEDGNTQPGLGFDEGNPRRKSAVEQGH